MHACSAEGCTRAAKRGMTGARGGKVLCAAHYERVRTKGNVQADRPLKPWSRLIQTVQDAVTSDSDECILWPWQSTQSGYGVMRFEDKNWMATHMVLTVDGRPRPGEEMFALHSCDVKLCINPRHLSWGTQQENMDQKVARGRSTILSIIARRYGLTPEEADRRLTG